jgi:RHS repeat-associated protein
MNGDGTLTLANSFTYTTWGAASVGTHNAYPDLGFRFRYVGRFDVQWDDVHGLGLYYMHARHYSPTLGRFLQPDPTAEEDNLYAYAASDPITKIDPDGTVFQKWGGGGGNLGGFRFAVPQFRPQGLFSYKGGVRTPVRAPVSGRCEVTLRCASGSTAAERAQMRRKAADLDRLARAGRLVKTQVQKSGRSATSGFRKTNRQAEFDWDHIHDLQLGGRDVITNLRRITSRVNRSAGAQIARQLRGQPYGTRITRVRYLE